MPRGSRIFTPINACGAECRPYDGATDPLRVDVFPPTAVAGIVCDLFPFDTFPLPGDAAILYDPLRVYAVPPSADSCFFCRSISDLSCAA